MSWWVWPLIALGAVSLAWLSFVGLLLLNGQREDARALAGFIPDCLMLVGRLLSDRRVARRHKLLLLGLLAYLALPFDLVPDFIPVAGQLDDVIVAAYVLRRFVRAGGEPLIRKHWPGPERSLGVLLRLTMR